MHERALGTFRKQIQTHPDLLGHHALEYLLEHGTPEESLALARRTHSLRPNGDSTLSLAAALERAGSTAEANALRKQVQESGWFIPAE